MKIKRNFIKGRMNTMFDERLIPNGEYVSAMNIRVSSTEESEMGAIENAKGNEQITTLGYRGSDLSADAVCIGSVADSARDTIYWCVHDPSNPTVLSGVLDMIVSYNVVSGTLIYHVISSTHPSGTGTVLNFSPDYRVDSMNIIDNLLFFTDNLNPPRRINTERIYVEPSNEDINVIVKPPSSSPSVELIKQGGGNNYIDTRFLCFAYRYKYRDGEYSALSQFSQAAFFPEFFSLDASTLENDGMSNSFNSAIITINTSSSNVVGIDLVFKFSGNQTINVVEKYDKDNMGWSDNSDVQIEFSNKKVYTTLAGSELGRLYDNVPRKAQAQTFADGRLIYGNYVDGYDLIDSDGQKCRLEFTTELVSDEVESYELEVNKTYNNYTIAVSKDVDNSGIKVNFNDISTDLLEGNVINIRMVLAHDSYYSTSTLEPFGKSTPIYIETSITLQDNYASVADFVSSDEFEAAIGTTTFSPISDCGTPSAGMTLTDQINCASQTPVIPAPGWEKESSGITAPSQGIAVTTTADSFSLTIVAMRYSQVGSPGNYAYEYFKVVSANVDLYSSNIGKSLHSNRNYEVSMIYMDDYNRSTTSLVSGSNTVNVLPSKSTSLNKVRVEIPTTQKPPSWATRYKFAIKPSNIGYETIYSNIYFFEDGIAYFLLEGDNQNKVQAGDTLIVKSDSNGPNDSVIKVSVLDIEAKPKDFIPGANEGLYMSLNPSTFNFNYSLDYIYDAGVRDRGTFILYPVYIDNLDYDGVPANISPTNTPYKPVRIPKGSIVGIAIRFDGGVDGSGTVWSYELVERYVSNNDYDNIYNFIIGENIDLTNGTTYRDGEVFADPASYPPDILTVYNPDIHDFLTPYGPNYITVSGVVPEEQFEIQFLWRDPNAAAAGDTEAGQIYLGLRNDMVTGSGTPTVECRVKIISGENSFIFETESPEADPELFYEGSQSFSITNNFHEGNIQDQTSLLPAISDLSFYDCFCFGNGAESYKIGDRIATPAIQLGERFYAVSQQDFKEADRFSDLTYSGIYNADTNLNRLNEFNLSLSNFKTLDRSFGSVRVLSGRASDLLVLQEDKVSYVLISKNLISSSQGGGTVVDIPEVLGTQIARIENFGIGNNPESYTEYGYDKYFVDPKRGAVIKLTGSGQAEQLSVISEFGMKSWFRDYFRLTPNTQKLGGYDPYTGEYVIAGNLNSVPSDPFVSSCGEEVTVTTDETFRTWEVILAPGSGEITVDYTLGILPMGEDVTFEIIYDGSTYSSGAVTSGGSFTFTKSVDVDIATVEVTLSSSFTTSYAVEVGCATENGPRMTQVVLAPSDPGTQYIHNDFYWTQGTYVSPTQSNLATLQNTSNTYNVSLFQSFEGNAGTGMIPPESGGQVTIRIQSTKKGFDNFDFGSSSLKYLLSTTDYSDSDVDIASMLSAATTLTPIQNPSTGVYYYDITYTQTPQFSPYIYLIYDYR